MTAPADTARRRDRVRRHLAKRPPRAEVTVEVVRAPCRGVRGRLVDLLEKLLDDRLRSGGR